MKPAPFHYECPGSLDEALALLSSEPEGNARVLAGGQTLVASVARRTIRPQLLVDVMKCGWDEGVSASEGRVVLGGGLRQLTAEKSPLLASVCPLLPDALKFVAIPQVRARGTVAGSLVQALPGGELPVVAMVLDGQVEVRCHGTAPRFMAAKDLYRNPTGSAVSACEIVTRVSIDMLADDEGWAFEELLFRRGHVAQVCVAATMVLDSRGRIIRTRLSLGGLNSNPYRAWRAESMLAGDVPGDAAIRVAAQTAAAEAPFEARADIHADSEYRMAMAVELSRRALARAAARARFRMARKEGVAR